MTGQCLCGAIRYEITANFALTGVCHCKNCQRQGGSAFSTLAGVPTAALKITGTPKMFQDQDTDSGNPVERYFCGACGSPIYSALPGQPDMVFLKTGTLDNTGDFKVQFHVWCDSKQPWVQLEEGVPAIAKGS
ncbi:MAG: GFA family protein [Pseudomonadota bacterium]